MRIIKIKNIQDIQDTYCGQIIGSNEYYTLQTEIERQNFAHDEKINQHLWSNPAKICINDGESDLSVMDGDKWLKGNYIKAEVTNEAIIKFSNRYFAKADAIYYSCPPNQVTFIDMLIDNKLKESEILSDENFECKFLRGGSVFGKNIEFGDWCKLQVVDKDGILVQMGHLTQEQFDAIKVNDAVVLKEYIVKRYAMPNEKEVIRVDAPGQIPVGSYLRCIYHATNSGNTREIYINYDLENLDGSYPF